MYRYLYRLYRRIRRTYSTPPSQYKSPRTSMLRVLRLLYRKYEQASRRPRTYLYRLPLRRPSKFCNTLLSPCRSPQILKFLRLRLPYRTYERRYRRIQTYSCRLSLRRRKTCSIRLLSYRSPPFSAFFHLRPLCRMYERLSFPRSRSSFYTFSDSYRLRESNRDRSPLSPRLPSVRTPYTYGSLSPFRYKSRSSSLPTRRRYEFCNLSFYRKRNPTRNIRRESGREPLSGVCLLISYKPPFSFLQFFAFCR